MSERFVKDRHVHASYANMDIVRYNRAGKWYLEPRNGLRRQKVTVREAVASAQWGMTNARGSYYPGLPGGATFDRLMSEQLP